MPARAEITPDLVKRVSERIASGIPIRLALAGEGVTVLEYKDHLFNHPELQAIQDVEKRKFLENAINMLWNAKIGACTFAGCLSGFIRTR